MRVSKGGRPRIFEENRMQFCAYLYTEQHTKLIHLARERGISPSALIRELIDALPNSIEKAE